MNFYPLFSCRGPWVTSSVQLGRVSCHCRAVRAAQCPGSPGQGRQLCPANGASKQWGTSWVRSSHWHNLLWLHPAFWLGKYHWLESHRLVTLQHQTGYWKHNHVFTASNRKFKGKYNTDFTTRYCEEATMYSMFSFYHLLFQCCGLLLSEAFHACQSHMMMNIYILTVPCSK